MLQLVIALAVDLPRFLSEGNPDVISGTFGENSYQLVFFLLVVAGLACGIFTFEKPRAAARLTPLLLIAILTVIFLAQYRSLLVTTALTIVLLGMLLSSVTARGIVVAALAGAAMLGSLAYVAKNIPGLKFGSTIQEAQADPTLDLRERLKTLDVIERVFADTPRFAVTGKGAGPERLLGEPDHHDRVPCRRRTAGLDAPARKPPPGRSVSPPTRERPAGSARSARGSKRSQTA